MQLSVTVLLCYYRYWKQQAPPPFRGLHSPGVRQHCQIIFACLLRKSSIQTRIAVISSFATTLQILQILGMAGALQLLKLAWKFYWQQYWQVGNRATKRCRCHLRFGHKLYVVDRDLCFCNNRHTTTLGTYVTVSIKSVIKYNSEYNNAWNVRDSFSQSSNATGSDVVVSFDFPACALCRGIRNNRHPTALEIYATVSIKQ